MAELTERVTASIAPDELHRLEQMARERRVSRSWLVREAILALLNKQHSPKAKRRKSASSPFEQ